MAGIPFAQAGAEIFRTPVVKFACMPALTRINPGNHPMERARRILLPGRRIGTGAAVGAGAVVTKDVPDYEIWAGSPAPNIRLRLRPGIARRLIALSWFDWPHDPLGAARADFRTLSAEAFLQRYREEVAPSARQLHVRWQAAGPRLV